MAPKIGKKLFTSAIFIVILVSVGILFFLSQQQSTFRFDFGFNPYGESTNQITDLRFVNDDGANLNYNSRFWTIQQKDLRNLAVAPHIRQTEQTFKGSDLNFISAHGESWSGPTAAGSQTLAGGALTTLTSIEDFSQRDFKATFSSQPDGGEGGTIAGANLLISLLGSSGNVQVVNHNFPGVSNPGDLHVVVHPSVVSDRVTIFVNGQETAIVNYVGSYKIKIDMTSKCGAFNPDNPTCRSTITMEKPSFKQEFGCTKEPGEQYYMVLFNEGDTVNMNKLEEFKKFCLAESPLEIFSNIGSTTDTEILAELINGESFKVPEGQIWNIEYIGDLTTFKTECEADEAYDINENDCLSRTVLTIQCAPGESFVEGVCEIETEPILFIDTSISTHQELENNGQFRFNHAFSDNKVQTTDSIIIGQSTFKSNTLSYNGVSQASVVYPEDKSNWVASFTYESQGFEGGVGDTFNLDSALSVTITNIEGYKSAIDGVEDYNIEYTFDLNTDFLTLEFDKDEILIHNSYKTFNGGITLTTKDILGTTLVDDIDKNFVFGKNKIDVNINDLETLKARAFLIVETPKFDYRLDAKNALSVDGLNDDGQGGILAKASAVNIFAIFIIAASVILVFIIAIMFIRRFKK